MEPVDKRGRNSGQVEVGQLYLVEAVLDPDIPAEEREVFLYEHVPWGWEESNQGRQACIHIYLESSNEAKRLCKTINEHFYGLAKCRVLEKENKDWSTFWCDFFQPRVIGDIFLILPSWEEIKDSERFLYPVFIHPQMAFGTGEHPTTYLCLRALACLSKARALDDNVFFLDLGTGSGILGIASTYLGYKGIGLDVDPVAIDNARLNSCLNKSDNDFCLLAGDVDCLKISGHFDLVLANIYAQPLRNLAHILGKLVKPSGFIILSGLLQDQCLAVSKAYEDEGWQTTFILQRDGWVALVLGRICL